MARKFLVAIDLNKNEIQNAVAQNLASAPSAPVKGQFYFNSTGGDNTLYWWDGSSWVPAKATGGAFPGYGSVPTETTYGQAAANGAATTVARSDHTHGTPALPTHNALTATADVAFSGFKLTGVGTPTTGTDAVTKDYADNLAAGLAWKDAVRIATTANITQSGLAAIDGVTPVANDRVLCKDQSTGSQNGIFLAQSGAWTRATDADAVGELDGATVFVLEGTANGDKAFTCTTNAPITPGTTATAWVQFGAGTSYSGGAGLTLTGSTFAVGAGTGITVNADDVAVNFAGTGAANTSARSDHNHDGTYTKKFAQDCAAATTTTVTHNFNTYDVQVSVFTASGVRDDVDVDVERPTVNSVLVRFATAPAAAAYRIVVTG